MLQDTPKIPLPLQATVHAASLMRAVLIRTATDCREQPVWKPPSTALKVNTAAELGVFTACTRAA